MYYIHIMQISYTYIYIYIILPIINTRCIIQLYNTGIFIMSYEGVVFTCARLMSFTTYKRVLNV